MSLLKKSSEDAKAESMLVLGTEHNDVIILNSTGMKVLKKVLLILRLELATFVAQ